MSAFHGMVGRAQSFSLLSFIDIVSPSSVAAKAFLGSDGRKPLPCFQRSRWYGDNHAVYLSRPADATAVPGDGSDTRRSGSQGPRCRSRPRTQDHHLHRKILWGAPAYGTEQLCLNLKMYYIHTYIHTVHIVYLTIFEICRELAVRQQQMDDSVGGEGLWIGNITAPGQRRARGFHTEGRWLLIYLHSPNIASACGTTTCCNNGELFKTDSNIAFI